MLIGKEIRMSWKKMSHKHETKNKCVVVLSGGPDSATVAYWAKKQGYQIYPITFNYGQIAVKETQAAKKSQKNLAQPQKLSTSLPSKKSLAT